MSNQTLRVVVARRSIQGTGIAVLELVAAGGGELPPFEAGAHVDVHLPAGLVRQYSLCGDPAKRGIYRLGVLRDDASRGGSLGVHEVLLQGVELDIGVPRNHFPLNPLADQTLLLAGGIGITPMMAMAYVLLARGANFKLHYCARSADHCAFLHELRESPFADRVRMHLDDGAADQKLDLAETLGASQSGLHVYVCGPAGFMDWVIGTAQKQGFSDSQIHREYFQLDVDTAGDAFEVVAATSGKTVKVEAGQSIVAALSLAGINVEVSCKQGVCGTCLCTVLEGTPDHRDVYLNDEEKASCDQMLLCCSRSRTARLVLDI